MTPRQLAAQHRNSQKSTWRNIPGTKDDGQRFEVHYRDGAGKPRIFGYTETIEGARGFAEAINQHPLWHAPRIFDREGKEWAE